MDTKKTTVRLAAVGDIHYRRTSHGSLQPLCAQITESADVLLLCGDIIDYGLPEEARLFTKELTTAVKIPILAVFGNHEYESGKQEEVQQIFADAEICVLDGDAHEVYGIGFAGVKGFAGGFGEHALQAWGEETLKRFVHDAVNETLKLESALAKLRTTHRIAILHYSPLQATVEGEPTEIFAFLGSSRLEEPLNRYPVTVVFHGHAHRGSPEGQTKGGVPVYNVAMPLLQRAFPERPPFRLVDIPLGTDVSVSTPSLSPTQRAL
ncbi:MAG TPA: metallophosphoesterase [Candidatus Binatia bacterium]|jgi:Icc-related predicted phosphoesterase|nr:metallophosphoesterase [Candidatus Binatia bacterium]